MAGIDSRGLRFGAFIVLFVLGGSSTSPAFSQALSGKGHISFVGGFAPVVKRVLPAVVNIASLQIVRDTQEETLRPFIVDPFHERRERGLGSGVIVDPSGYVMTNSHIVEGAMQIKISLSDKREFDARVVGSDPKTDIALLKIDAKGLPVLPFGDSSAVEVGEFVLAVGDPFGIGQTVTMGIISATGRGDLGIQDYEDFIQTDAAVNPGNSGGPMVNALGELIGINSVMVSGGEGNQGVGFAVPVNLARHVMDEILKHGKVIRGWLGAATQPLTPPMMKIFGLSGELRGALVSDVTNNSPAARSGLAYGDIILDINGEPIADSRTLNLKISMLAPGTLIRMKVFRDGHEREVTTALREFPAKSEFAERTRPENVTPEFGLSVAPLTSGILRMIGLPANTRGVLVTDVEPGSAADDEGLGRGDIVQEVNRQPVTKVSEFRDLIQAGGNAPVMFLINRGGEHSFVVFDMR